MKLAIKLAFKNLIGAGLRTWLNIIVLSFSFVIIIAAKGILVGWDRQAKNDMASWEIGGGQYWNEKYDPYDPFSLEEAHSQIPSEFSTGIGNGSMVPMLISQGTIYPEGRMLSILIKGIDPKQKLLELPTHYLDTAISAIPAIIGTNMAKSSGLKKGDYVTLRWRDSKGTFDAADIFVAGIFVTNVPTVDVGQIWIPLERLQNMLSMPREATVITFKDINAERKETSDWELMTFDTLVREIEEMIKTKSTAQSIFYIILLILALLAVFDTQVLSIFRRQKEIGTYVALGYTKAEVVWLFTIEGAMYAILAAVAGSIYGIPLLMWFASNGISLGASSADYGFAIAETMYPVYSISLITGTTLAVLAATTVVSYWPSRKISKMSPTEALRGKIQ
ncbi:MAG: FtsX-like permease family protein [Bacteroidales bacterium]|nr:FtsX-like permease family protein [Bacteroidales bacterium]MDD2425085.1 FtsX-like permease family protein [Bacteroidales bacterium]MDD3988588.1 FtsX-like permease family protein [Bacteroidales bacterium]MDD4639708.1 FtsX-like permease family protein [Bacteroidales bacterium]